MKIIANRYGLVKTRAGGMGIVYLCLDRQEDRPVALKTFRPEYLSDRAARDRFLREGTIWIELGRHPHIVRAHRVEHGGHGIEVYLILEWVAEAEGKNDASLRQWLISSRPLPFEQALIFALHIARGMKHVTATRPGLVHRDLKPENVLIGRDGLAKVTDFGLIQTLAGLDETVQGAAQPSGWVQLTQPGHTPGTPQYMAPEQWTPGKAVDARTDIYAFGCILYEMVTGQMAVIGNNLHEIKEAHLAGRVAERARPLPGEAGRVVQRCVTTDRDGRYRNWVAVEAAVMQAYQAELGRPALAIPQAQAETRAERIQAGWSYNAIGRSYGDISRFDVAMHYGERMLRIARAEQELPLEAVALNNLGAAHSHLGEPNRAIEYYKQALTIAREIGDRTEEGTIVNNLGAAYHAVGEPYRAIEYHEQALDIFLAIRNQTLEGRALRGLGAAYNGLGKPYRAIEYYEQALTIARKIGDQNAEGATLDSLGIIYQALSDPHQAIKYHDQALTISRKIGSRAGEGRALGSLGAAHSLLSDLRRAIEYYNQALDIAREIGDRVLEGTTLGNLGNAHDDLSEPHRAIEYHKQALAIAQEIGNRDGEMEALLNLGTAYAGLGEPHRAVDFYEQALIIARAIGDQFHDAVLCVGLAKLISEQGQVVKAVRYADQAVQAFTQVGHAQYAQQAQQLLAHLRGQRE